MNPKRKKPTSISADPGLPEITDDWIAGANLYRGEKRAGRGRQKLDDPRQLSSLGLPPKPAQS